MLVARNQLIELSHERVWKSNLYDCAKHIINYWLVVMSGLPTPQNHVEIKSVDQSGPTNNWMCATFKYPHSKMSSLVSFDNLGQKNIFGLGQTSDLALIKTHLQHKASLFDGVKQEFCNIEAVLNMSRQLPWLGQLPKENVHIFIQHGLAIVEVANSCYGIYFADKTYCVGTPRDGLLFFDSSDGTMVAKMTVAIDDDAKQDDTAYIITLWRYPLDRKREGQQAKFCANDGGHLKSFLASLQLDAFFETLYAWRLPRSDRYCTWAPRAILDNHWHSKIFVSALPQQPSNQHLLLGIETSIDTIVYKMTCHSPIPLTGVLRCTPPSFIKIQSHNTRIGWYLDNYIILLYISSSEDQNVNLVLSALQFDQDDCETDYYKKTVKSFFFATVSSGTVVQVKTLDFYKSRLLPKSLVISRDIFVDQSTTLPSILQFGLLKTHDTHSNFDSVEMFCLLDRDNDECEIGAATTATLNISRSTRSAALHIWLGNVLQVGSSMNTKKFPSLSKDRQVLLTSVAAESGKLRETGFFAYKACLTMDDKKPCIVTLFVPPVALVSNWTGTDPKKRFSDVLVVAIDRIPILPDGSLDGSFRPGKPDILDKVERALDPEKRKSLLPGVSFDIACIVCGRSEAVLQKETNTEGSHNLWVKNQPCNHVCCMQCHELTFRSIQKVSDLIKCPLCYNTIDKCTFLEQRELSDVDFFVDWKPTKEQLSSARSIHNPNFVYTVGCSLHIANFDTNLANVCSAGIHGFVADKNGQCYEKVIEYGASSVNMRVTKVPVSDAKASPSNSATAVSSSTAKSSDKVPAQGAKDCVTEANALEMVNLATSSKPVDYIATMDSISWTPVQERMVEDGILPSQVVHPATASAGLALWNQRDQALAPAPRTIYPTLEDSCQNPNMLGSETVAFASSITPGVAMETEFGYTRQVCAGETDESSLVNLIELTFGAVPALRPLLKSESRDLIQWSDNYTTDVSTATFVSAATGSADMEHLVNTKKSQDFEKQFPSIPDTKIVIATDPFESQFPSVPDSTIVSCPSNQKEAVLN